MTMAGSPTWVAFALAILALSAVATPAGAETQRIELRVSTTPDAQDCPAASSLLRAVERLTGQRTLTTDGSGAATVAEVHFSKKETAYLARVRVQGALNGERSLEDANASCAALADAVAITLGLLADEAPEAAPPPRVTGPVAAPSGAETRASARSAGGGLNLGATVAGGAAAGVVGPLAPVLSASLGMDLSAAVSVDVGVLWIPAQSSSVGRGVVLASLDALQAHGCMALAGRREAVRLRACLGPAVGAIRASGEGYLRDSSAVRPWFAAVVALAVGGPLLRHLEWMARVDAAVPLRQEAFSIDGVGAAYRPPPAGVFATAGLSIK
jgi:hypothetical protein